MKWFVRKNAWLHSISGRKCSSGKELSQMCSLFGDAQLLQRVTTSCILTRYKFFASAATVNERTEFLALNKFSVMEEENRAMSDRDRFDKFTERARKVLSLAQEEAQRFQHTYIGTEHLLLGLVREGEGVAAKVLSDLGIELYRVRNAVEFIIGRGDRIVLGEIGLTPRAKKVIELAVDEARRLNHHYIGTEHLLLGLVREGEGIAAGVLESLGVRLERARRETLAVLSGGSSEEQGNPPTGLSVPGEAASPLAEGEPARTWSYCGGGRPEYFRLC